MPVEVEPRAVDLLHAAAGINGFDTRRLAAVVKMRLERKQPRRLRESDVGIRTNVVLVRTNVEFTGAAHRRRSDDVLWHIASWIELQSELNVCGCFLAVRMNVHLE